MSKGLMDKVLGGLGLFEEVEVEEPVEEVRDNREKTEEERKNRKANVVNIHSQKQLKVVVIEPTTYEEAQSVAEHLKNRKPVVVNFEMTEREVARRMVDFISGTLYALGGTMQKVGNNIFLCAPNNVDIAFNHKEEANSLFSWGK